MSSVRVLVGTRKGAFVFTSDGKRNNWQVSGPHFAGWEIYHMKGSPVDPEPHLRLADQRLVRPDPPALRRRRQNLVPARRQVRRRHAAMAPREEQQLRLRCLRRNRQAPHHPSVVRRHAASRGSSSASGTWSPRFTDREHRLRGRRRRGPLPLHRRRRQSGTNFPACAATAPGPSWQPGAGGMCLHTVILDPSNPDRIYIAISAAGAFRTDDGGKSWKPINKGSTPNTFPIPTPKSATASITSPCIPARPDVLFMQKHWDVMRSDDAGDNWHEVSGNLPTDFGFVIDVHAHEPETLYVVPIKSDSRAFSPRRQAAGLSAVAPAAMSGRRSPTAFRRRIAT